MRFPLRIGATAAAVAAVVAAVLVGPAAVADDTAAIPGSAPNWLSRATAVGTPSGSDPISAVVDLAPKGGTAALDAFVSDVSTPSSAAFRQFLTRDQYKARFAPSTSAIAAVTAYLKNRGLTLAVEDDSTLRLTGTVAQANAAFSAALTRYRHDGQTVTAPSHDLRVPAAIAPLIAGVRGLDTTVVRMKPAATNVPPAAGFRNSTLCSSTYGTKKATTAADGSALPKFQGKTVPYSICGYTGAQLRKAYEQGSTLTGKGVGIAIVDAYASPTIVSDIGTYAKRNGDPAYTSGQFGQSGPGTYTDTDDCDAAGWFGEETLDIEAAHAMAPGAAIKYFAGASCNDDDLLTALRNAVNNPAVDVVSNSWGSSSELLSSTSGYEAVFKKAAAIGVSVLFSSGDSGDSAAIFGIRTVGYPASSPNVTAVGGTATAIGAAGTVTATTGWGTEGYALSSDKQSWTSSGYLYGAGGGSSRVFAKPSYQSSISGSGRQVPDVAMDADPTTGMKIGITQTFTTGVAYGEYRIGGTSLASPLLAGFVALSIQKNGALGFLNPAVYGNRAAFTDVKDVFSDAGDVRADYVNGEDASGGYSYTVRTLGDDSSLPTTSGYDNVTGVGVPTTALLGSF